MAQAEAAEQDREGAADVVMRAALVTVVSMAVQIGALVALSWAVKNREAVQRHGRRLLRTVRGDRTPGDTGQQVAEFGADISRISHAGGELS